MMRTVYLVVSAGLFFCFFFVVFFFFFVKYLIGLKLNTYHMNLRVIKSDSSFEELGNY